MDYRKKWNKLVDSAGSVGLRVKLVPSNSLLDYAGMNDKAASKFGFEMPTRTIYIDKGLCWQGRSETLKHELDERADMAKGFPYWKAHRKALKNEGKLGGIR